MYATTYYATYLGICAVLILWLGRVLHRAGGVLLEESFQGKPLLVKAVGQLLDIGFYLMSIGYVTAWAAAFWQMDTYGQVAQAVSGKVGGLLLMLGFVHLFNLLLLALFRRKPVASAAPGRFVMAMTRKATPKSEATRGRILEAALRVFRERGFQAATMREIATEAGVALGAAYYYFESKDAIVMAFYEQAQQQMEPELERILDSRKTLETRLRGLIGYKFEYFHSNRALMGALSAHIDPSHPLSPFSTATAHIRDRDIVFFARAVSESGVKLPPSILPYLPRLLWLYQMGLMLYWVYDRSAKQARTELLFEKTLGMMLLLLKLGGIPLLRPLYRPAGELLKAIYEEG